MKIFYEKYQFFWWNFWFHACGQKIVISDFLCEIIPNMSMQVIMTAGMMKVRRYSESGIIPCQAGLKSLSFGLPFVGTTGGMAPGKQWPCMTALASTKFK